jgi:hypothetical protein
MIADIGKLRLDGGDPTIDASARVGGQLYTDILRAGMLAKPNALQQDFLLQKCETSLLIPDMESDRDARLGG